MILKGGTRYYDTPVGVLCLDSLFPKPRGHLRNPLTFGFPVVTRVITGVDVPRLLFNPTPELLEPFVQAARELEADGVRAVTGSCGFMARFQGQIARELKVPVLLSSLVQLPLLRLLHGENAVIGVLTASAAARDAVRMQGMDEQPEFRETILENKRHDFDLDRLEQEIVGTAKAFARTQALDALLLECTDLSAFAEPVQKAAGIPVYDICGLVEYAAHAVCRRKWDQR